MTRYSANDDYFYADVRVPRNKFNIKDEAFLESIETYYLSEAYSSVLSAKNFIISKQELLRVHSLIFQKVFDWAGRFRQIDISKGKTYFANWKYIDSLIDVWEKEFCSKFSKKSIDESETELALKLAVLLIEFLAIHPFRDGNGRTIRLILDKIAYDRGYELLLMHQNVNKMFVDEYMKASETGVLNKNYEPMKEIILSQLIRR
ncbi:MAG: Fic/DOC family protein [bacterium]